MTEKTTFENLFGGKLSWRLSMYPLLEQVTEALCGMLDVLVGGVRANREDIDWLKNEMTNVNHFMDDEIKSADDQPELGECLNNLIEPKSKEPEDTVRPSGTGDSAAKWIIHPACHTWAKPCPSCGNTGIDESGILAQPLSGQRIQYLVRCPKCSYQTGHFEVLMDAIRNWNNISLRK